ncbi:hypothetical protein TIFTF001_038208 [Ficus carica]|uniref:Uncharacterized protein n=1 Tax=Ficus carica TaxID=3494 RepID=A0AA88JCP3_FICCA|nr:hypothetical protein TIFTF001_038208 [Ficus carica]
MSDISDSENIGLSENVDAAGSAASTSSMGSSSAGEATGPRDRTPDHLSGISDIPSGSDHATPTSRGQTGAARLEEILRVGPSTAPDRQFVEELGRATQARPPRSSISRSWVGMPQRGLPARPAHLVEAAMWHPTAPTRPGRRSMPANGLVAGGRTSTT